MLCTFSFGCFQIYQNKSAKNIAVHFIGTIVPIKCMPKISAVVLFCLDKFENNQTRTCTTFFRTSKLAEVYFRMWNIMKHVPWWTWFQKICVYNVLWALVRCKCLWEYKHFRSISLFIYKVVKTVTGMQVFGRCSMSKSFSSK